MIGKPSMAVWPVQVTGVEGLLKSFQEKSLYSTVGVIQLWIQSSTVTFTIIVDLPL